MSVIRFYCKACGGCIVTDALHVGSRGGCPRCKASFVVPPTSAQATSVATPISIPAKTALEQIAAELVSRSSVDEADTSKSNAQEFMADSITASQLAVPQRTPDSEPQANPLLGRFGMTAAPVAPICVKERPMETCENCGRTIGKLETPHRYENHVVCPKCDQLLQGQKTSKSEPTPAPYTQREGEHVQVRKKKQIFAAMSCLGTVLLLMGLVMEWQAAEDFHLQTTGEIGGIMAFIGGVGLIVGLLGFAAARLRE